MNQTKAGVTERLRVLSARVLSIQEDERRRISRDLHDDIGQSVTALKFGLHRLANCQHPETEGAGLVSECIAMADATLERLRQLAYDMRPPQLDQLGLEEALRWLVQRQRTATGLDIKCHFNGLLNRRFAPEMESASYRITQEALSNATRHANPRSILVAAEASPRALTIVIRDDGLGFDTRAVARRGARVESLGLISMDERAILAGGRLSVSSDPGHGTMVRAVFGLAKGAA